MVPEDPLAVSISSNSLLHPDEISRKTFPTARKGLEADAVRRYLDSLSADVRDLLEREAHLRHRLADAERRAAEPELDEAMLTRAVGLETARILQTAHQAARDVIANAEARAAQLVETSEGLVAERSVAADEEAAGILAGAEQEALQLAAATVEEATALRDSAQREADELVAAAGNEAAAVLATTKQECRQMVREARELRHRVLNDLAERRRGLRVQLAQLRTGRDSLIEVVDAVGDAVDRVRDRLAAAEHEARLAAAQAGERVEQYEHDEAVLEEQQVRLPLGAEAEPGIRNDHDPSVDPSPSVDIGPEAGSGEAVEVPALLGAAPQFDAGVSGPRVAVEPAAAAEPLADAFQASRAEWLEVESDPETEATRLTPEESRLAMALAVDEGLATDLIQNSGQPHDRSVVEALEESVAEEEPPAEPQGGGNDAGLAVAGPSGSHRSVGELFARLRAGRGSGAGGQGGPETTAEALPFSALHPETGDQPAGGLGQPAAGDRLEPTAEDGLEPTAEDRLFAPAEDGLSAAGDDASVAPEDGLSETAEGGLSEGVLSSSSHELAIHEPEDDLAAEAEAETAVYEEEPASEAALAAALSRRTELLAPVMTRLSRALKRALQDDQNELLDSIRHASSETALEALLPTEAHRQRYQQAASLALSEAWTLGRLFMIAGDGDSDAGGAEKLALKAEEAGRELGGQLGLELTGLLRHRLSQALAAGGGVSGTAHDVTGAAYREWKGSRIEALAGDFAIAAFSKGEVTAGEGMLIRWVVDDDGRPCPDCDDNSLALAQAAGEVFPTGQQHPPVHAGCRCLLVPAQAP